MAAEDVAGGSSLSFPCMCVVPAAPLPFLLCLNQPQGHLSQEGLFQLPGEHHSVLCSPASRRLKAPAGTSLILPPLAERPGSCRGDSDTAGAPLRRLSTQGQEAS